VVTTNYSNWSRYRGEFAASGRGLGTGVVALVRASFMEEETFKFNAQQLSSCALYTEDHQELGGVAKAFANTECSNKLLTSAFFL
jgi:hypothetical protein